MIINCFVQEQVLIHTDFGLKSYMFQVMFLPESLAFIAASTHHRIRVGYDGFDNFAFVVEFFPFAHADAMVVMADIQVGTIVTIHFVFTVFHAVDIGGAVTGDV